DRLRPSERLIEAGDADLGVATDHLDQQPLLGPEVVVEEAAADPGLARDLLESRPRGAAPGHALTHGIDNALRLLPAQLAPFGRRLHRHLSLGAGPETRDRPRRR